MFIPTPDSPAVGLDQAVRDDLAASLHRIAGRASSVLAQDVDTPAFIAAIRAHRVHPGVFGRYYDLIDALQARNWDAGRRLWSDIVALTAAPAGLSVIALDPRDLDDDVERYRRMFTSGLATPPELAAPGEDAVEQLRRSVPDALSLLDATHPPWAAELRALVVQIVAVAPPTPDATAISGGSSFMLWGAVLVNVMPCPDRVRLLSVLAHEATHQFLLGMARNTPLVTNPVSERFNTELRPTPRPMNALFHSTYVSGRIHALCEILTARSELSDTERAHIAEVSDLQRRRFEQGCTVILREAALTELGGLLIEEARDVLAQATD